MLEPDTTPTRLYQFLLRRTGNKVEDPELKGMLREVSQLDSIDNYDLSDLFDLFDEKDLHLVLLLDEFENIAANGNFGPEFYYGLRSLAIHHNLALITASRFDLVELSRSDAVRSSPFFNIFATINLQPFSTRDVGDLLKSYLSNTEVSFSQTEVQYLWQIAGGNPFLLQMASSILFRAHQAGRQEPQRLATVHAEFPIEAKPHLRSYWESATEDEKVVLAIPALLHGQKTAQGRSWTVAQLEGWFRRTSNVVSALARRGLLNRAHDQYFLFSTTFADTIVQELTSVPTASVDSEEWRQQIEAGLVALPEGARSRAGAWLTNTRTKYRDLFLKWLSDPHTTEACLELLINSGASFEAIGEVVALEAATSEGVAVTSLTGVALARSASGEAASGQQKSMEEMDASAAGEDVELIFTPPPDPIRLLQICQWLEQTAKAEIEETTGSAEGDLSVRVFLKKPVPLVDMLRSLAEVEEVSEMPQEEREEGKGPRLLKRRKDTRGRTPAPLQRLQVRLRPISASQEPAAASLEEAATTMAAEEESPAPDPEESAPSDASDDGDSSPTPPSS